MKVEYKTGEEFLLSIVNELDYHGRRCPDRELIDHIRCLDQQEMENLTTIKEK